MKLKYKLLIIIFWKLFLIVPTYANDEVQLYPGEKLQVLQKVEKCSLIKGWTRIGKGVSYLLPIKKGEHLKVMFSSKIRFTSLAIFDLSNFDTTEAIYSSDIDGTYFFFKSKKASKLLLRPYYPKASRRRGLGAPYRIYIQKVL